ncbi:MAG: hypothetical protein ACOX6E_10445 [Syntrophomonadaceae bacterium]|jgi:hypothetical protein
MDIRITAIFAELPNAQETVKELNSKKMGIEDISLISSNTISYPKYPILNPAGNNIATSAGAFPDQIGLNPEAQLIQLSHGASVIAAGSICGLLALNHEDGVLNALINYGINAEQSRHLTQSILNGQTVLVLRGSHGNKMEITELLNNHGALEVQFFTEYNDGLG